MSSMFFVVSSLALLGARPLDADALAAHPRRSDPSASLAELVFQERVHRDGAVGAIDERAIAQDAFPSETQALGEADRRHVLGLKRTSNARAFWEPTRSCP